MPVEAFSSTSSIVGALNGGITAIDRALLSGRGNSQVQAAQSIQDRFASRIDAAILVNGLMVRSTDSCIYSTTKVRIANPGIRSPESLRLTAA